MNSEKDGNAIVASLFSYYIGDDSKYLKDDTFLNTKRELGEGKHNTFIIAQNNTENSFINNILKLNDGDFNDWAIPSQDELTLMVNKLYLTGIFKDGQLISSTKYIDPYYKHDVIECDISEYYTDFYEKNVTKKDASLKNVKEVFKTSHVGKTNLYYSAFRLR